MQAASVADLYSSQGRFVSQLRGKKTSGHEVPDGWTSSEASSVCCLQLQPPLEDSIHPLVLLRNCTSDRVSVWRSMRSFTLAACAARTCLGAAVHTYPPPPHPLPPSPPIEAVHSASHGLGRTIDPAEMMVSKREAVSMSALPSSTVEGPWDITKLSTLHHHRMGKWDFHWETSWGEGNLSRQAMSPTEDVKWAILPSDASHSGQIRSF